LSFLRVDPCTSKLSVVCFDIIPFHSLLHRNQGICK
jgi:hypothetical protein